MPKEKVNYQEVYDLYQLCSETKDLYQLCSETKDLKEFCSEYGVNYGSHLRTPSRTAGCRSQTISVNRK